MVDFGNFLDSLLPSLVASYGVDPERVHVHLGASEVMLPITAAMPCGLLANELISNALKHAFPGDRRGEVQVELVSDRENEAVLSVSDDGVGLPEDLDLAAGDTLGLQLASLLTDQLGGAMSVHRAHPTRFDLRFPMER